MLTIYYGISIVRTCHKYVYIIVLVVRSGVTRISHEFLF